MRQYIYVFCALICFPTAIVSSFNDGLIAGFVTNDIRRNIIKNHIKNFENTAVCIRPNPNPYAPENLLDAYKCYPTQKERVQLWATFSTAVILMGILHLTFWGSEEDRDFIYGMIVANCFHDLFNDDGF